MRAIGRNCRFLQAEDRDQPGIQELKNAIAEGKGCTTVLRNYRKDGTLFWNEVRIAPIRDETGRLSHFVGVQNDITQRKEMEQALRESEAKFRVLSEDSSAVIFIVHEDRFAYVNPVMEEITGYELKQLLEMYVSDIVHPDHRDLVLHRGRLRMTGKDVPKHYEVKFLHSSGQERWATLSAAVVDYEGKKGRSLHGH